jgi:phosphoenolpyruvate-protein kinase (PTS system EI component)
MAASSVPLVKQMVRSIEIDACARLARRVMEQADLAKIEELLLSFPREA